jgi:DNA repair exonuclease SbcCD ATPase subunit
MKRIIFKHVSIKNFLSIGDDPIDIHFQPGLHIITGVNKDKEDSKNGVGKSSITDGIFFGLFGSPLRNIKKDIITNWINKKNCSVTLSFDVEQDGQVSEYIITRSLHPSRVQLLKNGEDISRTIGKTNEMLATILGTTPDVFEQSVIMCLNQVEPFLSKTPAVKRKFIEDVFKIEIFGKMTQYMRNDFNTTTGLYNAEANKIEDLQTNLDVYQRQQNEQADKKSSKLVEFEARKKNILEELREIIDRKTNLEARNTDNEETINKSIGKLKVELKVQTDQIKESTSESANNQASVLNLQNKIKELEKLTDGVCAYCKQEFSEDNKAEKQKQIAECKTQIKECNVNIDTADEKINVAEKLKNRIDELLEDNKAKIHAIEIRNNEIVHINADINQQNTLLTQVEADIEATNNDTNSFEGLIKETTERLEGLRIIAGEYKSKLDLIETGKFIVSDEGVKNFIVKKMLKLLNGRLSYYLRLLDANCLCEFDEYFEETIINNRGRSCSYFSFSGGERIRIDLAMLFTFMDIRKMQSNVTFNISMYDELLDTSLDAIGIENALNILKDRVLQDKEAIYVISHRNEAAKHATGEIVYLEKENDITRRKTYEQ